MADRSVVIRLKADVSEFTAKMRAAGASAKDSLGDALGSAEQKAALNDLGNTAGKVGAIAAAGLGLASKAAMDWESAWAGVQKTVDGSATEMAALEAELRGLATSLPASHQDIAAVAEAAGQLGIARQDVADFTATMIDLGETTNLTADEAATTIAQMANVMGTAPEDIERVGAALVALGNDGASTEREILGMAQRIAGAGAQIGLTEADILAVSNAAVSMGVEVEAGGTAVTRVFTDMAKATKQGGEQLDLFAQVAGVTADEFATAFSESPAQAFAMFTQGLDRINKSGGDVFTTLDQIGLSDVRVSQALLGMSAAGDLLTDSLTLGAEAWEENTALSEEAAKRYETSAARIQVSFNKIRDAAIEVGEVVLPVLAEGAEAVGTFADAVGELPDPVVKAGAGLAAMVAVLGGGLWFTSKTIQGIANTKAALRTLGVTAHGTRTALLGVSKAAGVIGGIVWVGSEIVSGLDDMERSANAASAEMGSLAEIQDALAASNLGKYADKLGVDLDRLASDLNANGREGEYVKQVMADLGGASGSFATLYDSVVPANEALGYLGVSWGVNATEAGKAEAAFATLLGTLGDTKPGEAAAEAQRMAAYRARDLAVASREGAEDVAAIGDAALSGAEEVDEFADALKALEAIFEDRSDARNYEAALDDMTAFFDERKKLAGEIQEAEAAVAGAETKSERKAALEHLDALRENWAELEVTLDTGTAAGRANEERLDNLAQSALDVADSLDEADRRDFLKQARKDFINAARDLDVPKKAAEDLATELGLVAQINPRVRVRAEQAIEDLDAVLERVMGLDGEEFRFTVVADVAGAALDAFGGGILSGKPKRKADGGAIHGPGTGTSDSIPALLSNGEHVITAAEVQAAGGHGAIYAWRQMIRGYAAGGAVSFASRPAPMPAFANGGAVGGGSGRGGGAPMIGTQYVMPHNYNEFVRQQEANQRAADGGGI